MHTGVDGFQVYQPRQLGSSGKDPKVYLHAWYFDDGEGMVGGRNGKGGPVLTCFSPRPWAALSQKRWTVRGRSDGWRAQGLGGGNKFGLR